MLFLRCFIIFSIYLAACSVRGETSTDDFISIDCGINNDTTYQDTITDITYASDGKYIDTGGNYNITSNYVPIPPSQQYYTVRYFPNGTRNCYNLRPVTKDSKYLLRAMFFYGNYDGLSSAKTSNPLQFDLYIGVNFWKRVNITNPSREYAFEIVHVANEDLIWVCLLNIGRGTPFISALELRPLKISLYPYAYANQSNAIFLRYNYGLNPPQRIRYPDDPYDRFWHPSPYTNPTWQNVSTQATIQHYSISFFEAPISVLQTAITLNISANLTNFATWRSPSNDLNFQGYYTVIHFAELQNLTTNETRQFNISFNDFLWYGPYEPPYLRGSYIYDVVPQNFNDYNFSASPLDNSTYAPIINAIEVYSALQILNKSTQIRDVDAIIGVKGDYQIVKNWNGDPCFPVDFVWIGLNCNYINLDPPKITSINLSYFGLIGKISEALQSFQSVKYLDLSHNNLTGQIPDFLGTIQSLQVLNLSGNNFTGPVPDSLIKKYKSGYLVLVTDTCFDNCGLGSPSPKQKISTVIIAVIAAVGAVLLIICIASIAYLILSRKTASRQTELSIAPIALAEQPLVGQTRDIQFPIQSELRKFSFLQLKDITNNFSQAIGSGGFGDVYHGRLENGTEVAVKLCSQASLQGNKQFHAEAASLGLAHHRNLVSLVGYCKEENNLALVYEYMSQGSLHDHLIGKTGIPGALNWRTRLRISIESAQGLDYLHTGCGIIHRDVKSSNILLGVNLQAKIGDFGLAKIFDADTYSSLISISGTPGYLDPEYQRTYKLTEKSDVYSFGVVLLELITGNPPIVSCNESKERLLLSTNISKKLAKGNIEDIADPKLNGEYLDKSMWKVVAVALNCTEEQSFRRPTMAEVVMQLKDSLMMDEGRENAALWQGHESSEGTNGGTNGSTVPPSDLTVKFAPSAR